MRVCVYGASSTKIDPVYIEEGEKLGIKVGMTGREVCDILG